MTTLIITVHVLACVAVIILVLLQSGKEGMGVIFGGGSQSVFGSTGAGGLLVKLTALFGALFLITSLVYNASSGSQRRSAKSVMMDASGAPVQIPVLPDGAAKDAEPKKGVTFEEIPAPGANAPAGGAAKQ
ncbi:preprotein translocase subunit SecG [Desulfovibrio aerotolerans]|uniref:Protein-export membrane protein SecG n=1 Tax=Solidesulfovibrio aerotolerans TaxID=295255 RepID=A0A7C9J6U6_9BACT|nr:preprotein translocase subunit SecG [Solidesulfovibrio aerotolerans]MYL81858.1 preprotein translocase subunit SecG [Solidesulfovibrio aerotolerans]